MTAMTTTIQSSSSPCPTCGRCPTCGAYAPVVTWKLQPASGTNADVILCNSQEDVVNHGD